jgi:hypothetical protein
MVIKNGAKVWERIYLLYIKYKSPWFYNFVPKRGIFVISYWWGVVSATSSFLGCISHFAPHHFFNYFIIFIFLITFIIFIFLITFNYFPIFIFLTIFQFFHPNSVASTSPLWEIKVSFDPVFFPTSLHF